MGIILEQVCCIDSNNFTQNENNISSLIKENHHHPKEKINLHYHHLSPFLNTLPKNEIKFPSQQKNNKLLSVKSLKTLPINTQNIIRKHGGNPLDYYDIIKKLGKGTFGTVYKVIHKTTGCIRAMKVIPKNNMKYGFTDDDIIQEINIMKTLEHPHIIKLFEFYIFKENYYLINEFCTEGDLSDKLAKLKVFPEFVVKILMIQIFNAVKYLNEKNIIHGDLKLENIMIDSYLDNGDLIQVKNKNNFITSLLEDEKEIKEYIQLAALRRSSTYHPCNKKKLEINKFNEKNIEKNEINKNENINDVQKLLKLRMKRGKTFYDISKFAKNKNIEINNIKNLKNKNNTNEEISLNRYNSVTINGEDKFLFNKPNGMEVNGLNFNYNSNRKQKIIPKIFENNNINEIYNKINENEKEKCNTPRTNCNINLKSMKIKNFELKLIDFGCAKIFSKHKKNFEDTIGTLIYCSPEVLKNNYNKKCDIWSCGVLMYVLLSGHFPFFGKTQKEIKKKILSGQFTFDEKYFSNISDKAKDLISKCLIYNKNKRISIEEVLKHEFFADDLNPNNIFQDDIDSRNALISIKNYSQQPKIYQTVLAYLSHNFAGKGQLNKLKKIFYKIDLNLDGKLSKEELYTAFKEAGMEMPKEELDKVVESIDFDGNGYIEYEEFIRVTLPKEQLFTDANLKTAFDMFDLDKNGTISLTEFKEILGLGKNKDINVNNELLEEIPIKGNEEINFEQFKRILLGTN